MRTVSEDTTQAWLGADKTGPERRPIVRATIQKVRRRMYAYDSHDELNHMGYFNSYLFGQPHTPVEIPNIESFTWSRSVEQDVASATLTLLNSRVKRIGGPKGDAADYEQQGYFTPSRGTVFDYNPWGYDTRSAWADLLIPDRLVRTYEGYGMDITKTPGEDPHLYASGVWWVDDVTFTHDGRITVKMRDYGRILLDTIVFPSGPVPFFEYPMIWEKKHTEERVIPALTGGAWNYPNSGKVFTSNSIYVGKDIETSDGSDYVSAGGLWNGTKPTSVFNDDDDKFWTSTGQTGSGDEGTRVWWQANLSVRTNVSAIRIKTRGGPYRVYISIGGTDTKDGADRWYGKRKIPYKVTTEDVDVSADIPLVMSEYIPRNRETTLILPKIYRKVSRIRITLRGLSNQIGGTDTRHPWRASLRRVQMYSGKAADLAVDLENKENVTVGNYSEFSQIIKYVTAWAGYYWPESATADQFWKYGPATSAAPTYPAADDIMPRGRSWGTFMNTGTAGIADLTADNFDKQPLFTIIRHVADMLGYLAYTDESGGFVFRLPNIYKPNNYIAPADDAPRGRTATTDFLTLHEDQTLLSYSTTLSGRNLRETLFVANTSGRPSVVTDGYMPNDADLSRVAGWSAEEFANVEEVGLVADLVATKQKFSYRAAQARIHGNPAIQVDDQIRIYERTTNETYFHYVSGISSTLDMKNGTWFYDLTTHWLGETAEDSWVVDVQNTRPRLKRYLMLQGIL